MNHLAIDLGSRESQICVRNSEGVILEEERRPTTGLGRYLAWISTEGRFPKREVFWAGCAASDRCAG